MPYVLAIETSCDDTSVALVGSDRRVAACLVASQDLDHSVFGGVVPEIASRSHTAHLLPLIDQALKQTQVQWTDIMGIAATNRPGLVGALIVGLVTAKSLALAYDKPFLGVHHIEGHIMAPFLIDDAYRGPEFFRDEFLALIVSGGHTQLYHVKGFSNYHVLGQTIDDAAGEAFDKFGKMIGLPYPGGRHVDLCAKQGDPTRFSFPRPLLKEDHYNFSFSGLKSAAQRLIEPWTPEQIDSQKADLCASYQQAIVDVLIAKLSKALKQTGVKNFVVSGGVSANSSLRQRSEELAAATQTQLAIPPLRFCTDNAAMIGLVGQLRMQAGERSPQDLPPIPRDPL